MAWWSWRRRRRSARRAALMPYRSPRRSSQRKRWARAASTSSTSPSVIPNSVLAVNPSSPSLATVAYRTPYPANTSPSSRGSCRCSTASSSPAVCGGGGGGSIDRQGGGGGAVCGTRGSHLKTLAEKASPGSID